MRESNNSKFSLQEMPVDICVGGSSRDNRARKCEMKHIKTGINKNKAVFR